MEVINNIWVGGGGGAIFALGWGTVRLSPPPLKPLFENCAQVIEGEMEGRRLQTAHAASERVQVTKHSDNLK